MPLLDALRALTSFAPPPALPDCDLPLLADVLEAHGLAPMASWQLEHGRIGAGVPTRLKWTTRSTSKPASRATSRSVRSV